MSRLKVAIAAAVLGTGCSPLGPQFVRHDPPIQLESGPPRTPCEREHFVELVPTYAKVTSEQSTPVGNGLERIDTATVEGNGWAAYKLGHDQPELLLPLLSGPGQEQVLASHLQPMRPIIEKRQQAQMVAWAGLGTMGLGALIGMGGSSLPPDGAASILLRAGGLVTMCVGSFVAFFVLAVRPTATEDAELTLLERLFIGPYDQPAEVRKAMDARNQQLRRECEAGTPTPNVRDSQ